MIRLITTFLAVCVAEPATASTTKQHPCRSKPIASGKVEAGGDDLKFRISSDKRQFRLEGLLRSGGALPLPIDTQVELHTKNAKPDRYGRISAQMFAGLGGEWVQGRSLRQGLAFQYALGARASCLTLMRKAEGEARRDKRGLWRNPPLFDARATDDLLQHIGEFVIVTGIVKSVGDRKRRLYLNFGSNWSEDTTVVLTKKGSGAYRGDVAVLRRLEGKRVEIRGILDNAQGPLIRLTDEAQIDILDR